MPPRTIAIGDIHGCAQALQGLLKIIDPQPADRIITLGDYVDRGPHSKEVIEQLIALQSRCQLIPLLGNHEIMLLDASDGAMQHYFWLQCGGAETLASYGGKLEAIPQEHLDFLCQCRRFFETQQHIFLHANYAPELSPERQPEDLMFWEHLSNPPPPPHRSGKTVVVGHTPQVSGEVLDWGHVICIDTFCFGSGYLTALDVEAQQIWQVDKFGLPRSS